MKLIIQIPCFNEEKTLKDTFDALPRSIEGIDTIEVQVIDDGSTDGTLEVSNELGVDHVISFTKNRGLAAAFKAGMDHAILEGADILVNTDGDNQYSGKDIAKLVKTLLREDADIVVGCRPIDKHPNYTFAKRFFHKIGSWSLRKIADIEIKDPPSGFRAYSRNALFSLNIYSDFSYCMETLIQASFNNMKISSVDIDVNDPTRESRLFKGITQYIWKSVETILYVFLIYRSKYLFNIAALTVFIFSLGLFLRFMFLVTFYGIPSDQFWPTIILSGVLLAMSFQIYLSGVVASLITSVRILTEDLVVNQRKVTSKRRK